MAFAFNPLTGQLDLVGGGTPAGSNTQVQFNDSGAFGGDSNFIWDKTNDRLGVQVTAPQVPIHASSVTGTTLNDVTVGSASLVAETLPTAPTGSITKITEPTAGSGGSLSFIDQGSGGFGLNDTDVVDIRVTPCLLIDSTYYASQFSEIISNTVSSGTDVYNLSGTAGVVIITGETTYYKYEYQVNGGGYTDLGITNSNTYSFSNSASATTASFPTFYANIPATPPSAFTDGSASGQDVGSGSFTEVPTTVLMEVDSVANIGGIDYVSGSPTSGSFDDSGMGSYNPEIAWTDNGGATNAIARVSQDSGSTWIYQFTGSSTSPYKFTSTGNDSIAEARWGQTYTSGDITHTFYPYSTSTTPSGSALFSTVGSTYTTTVPADSVNYIFKHTFTGGTAPYKILAPSSVAYGKLLSSPYYDIGYNTWSDGLTVTPQSYGFTGTNQNRDYRLYSSGSGIFSVTPLTISTTSGSGSKSVSGSFTYPSGVTTIKILRQINGGGYTVSKTFTSPTTTFTDDSSDTTWSGNTTITPTSLVGGTARFDKSLTSLSNEPQLALVDTTGSGTRYSMLGFGVATDSSSAPTYNGRIYASSDNVMGTYIGSTERERANTTGRFFGGTTTATDLVHIGAGTTSVAPLRLTSGSLTTGVNIRAGQVQFLTDKLYTTITTGTAVKEITLNDSALTASRVPVTTTNGRLTSSSVTSTELGYVSGVTSAIQTQFSGKQATLVSGTNIKTINSTSLLGSGDIAITGFTDELAQDAVGAMVNSTLTYVDATPSLGINLANANTWTAKQTIQLTTNQFTLGYSANSKIDFTVDSIGSTIFEATNSSSTANFMKFRVNTMIANEYLQMSQGSNQGMTLSHTGGIGTIDFRRNNNRILISNSELASCIFSGSQFLGDPWLGGTSASSNDNAIHVYRSGTGLSQTMYFYTQTYATNGAQPALFIAANGYTFTTRDTGWNSFVSGINTLSMASDGRWTFNETGGDYDVRIEGDTDANLFFTDASADKIGIGTSSPSAKLHLVSTTEQFRSGYDASNYYSTTVGSTGGVTFNAVGSGALFTFSDNVVVPDIKATTYHVGTDAGIDATVTYVDTVLGAQTLTFKKGILTNQA